MPRIATKFAKPVPEKIIVEFTPKEFEVMRKFAGKIGGGGGYDADDLYISDHPNGSCVMTAAECKEVRTILNSIYYHNENKE